MKFLKDFDKHFNKNRDDLSKYCYDISKIIIAGAVLERIFAKELNVMEVILGALAGLIFLIFGILFKK